jgi:hypothetical protein
MFHVRGRSLDGINGISIHRQARDAIALARAIETYGARFFANDASIGTYLEHPGRLSKEAGKRLKDDLLSWIGVNRAHMPKVIEEGMKLNRLSSMPARDAQLTEAQQEAVIPICQFFRMPPHKIQHLLRATFSNIEHQGIEFATDTMLPWARRFESRINATLITDSENFAAEFLFAGLMRGDNAGRAQYYQARFNMASLSPNDIRRLDNENPIDEPWADEYYLQGAMVPASRAGEFLDRRAGATAPRRGEDAAKAGGGETPTLTAETRAESAAVTEVATVQLLAAKDPAPARAFAVLIADVADRIAGAERRAIEKRPAKLAGEKLAGWLAAFYREHAGYVVRTLTPLAEAWEAETGRRVHVRAAAFAVHNTGFTAAGDDVDAQFTEWSAQRAAVIAAAIHEEFDHDDAPR